MFHLEPTPLSLNKKKKKKKVELFVIPQVLDENQCLFLILIRFLYVFCEGNGKENNAVAMVTYKISSQMFSISQRETYPFLHKLG